MDIVKRLRSLKSDEYIENLVGKAADEIERLREAAKDRPKDRPKEAADEIERLRKDRERLEAQALYLFGLLDDIDTADDEAKDNDDFYRKRVRYLHHKRFLVATTDGYRVTLLDDHAALSGDE